MTLSRFQSIMSPLVQFFKPAEGVVVRSQHPSYVGSDRLSFKVINLDYKEKS